MILIDKTLNLKYQSVSQRKADFHAEVTSKFTTDINENLNCFFYNWVDIIYERSR